MVLEPEFPDAMGFLFHPARYKVLYGGRGGAKSWGIARTLLCLAFDKPLRILCAREIQKSISESVHQLLKDQISALGLDGFYTVHADRIEGANGSLFLFAGLKHNVQNIKSKEGVDIVWVEEAQGVSKNSWATLIPTIRKDGSEIWVSFNPELDTDETYTRFVLNPPPGAKVVKVNWSDNKWFPAVLREEKDHLAATDPDAYLTVWEGHCKAVLDGAIFANEIRKAMEGGQFTRIPYNATIPVHVFLDLGRRDKTAIWFVQQVAYEYRIIDYYENRGPAFGHYIKHLKEQPYVYGDMWLPHDAQNELLASELTIEQQARNHGFDVKIVPKTTIAARIEAARSIFNKCYFDEERAKDGLQCLRRWRFDVDPDTGQYSKAPLHDDASHGADAFTYMAVAMTEDSPARGDYDTPNYDGAWMG